MSYVFSDTAVTVNLGNGVAQGQGKDILGSIENVTGSQFADRLVGDDGANLLFGGAGDDTLLGGLGNDILLGFADDDRMVGGAGVDSVNYSFNPNAITANLATGIVIGGSTDTVSDVEAIIGTAFDDSLTGSDENNTILGLGGNDTIRGRGGADSLSGNEGNDLIVEADGLNTLAGGDGNDRLQGGVDRDLILGEADNDVLEGAFENDTLMGGAGDDRLRGELGRDELTGGAGRDVFFYVEARELGVFGLTDRITDFERNIDKISLRLIDANTTNGGFLNNRFDFIGTAAFSGRPGELRYFKSGGETFVEANTDRDSQPNFDIVLTGTINLHFIDFEL